MNAFIAAVLEKKTILVANEARLLKKKFSWYSNFSYGTSGK